MHGLPKIVLERLKREGIGKQLSRQSTIDNRQSAMGDWQSAIENRPFPHPDANLLSAFVEKALTERERTELLNHLAQCAECRELVALTLPAKVDVAQLRHLPARGGWLAWPALRWGALAVALGAVAIVVVLHPYLPRRQESVPKAIRPVTMASASKAAPQPPAASPAQPSPRATVAEGGRESRGSRRERAKLEKRPGPAGGQQIAAQPAGAEAKERVTLIAAAPPPVAAQTAPAADESVAVSKGLSGGVVGGVTASGRTLSGPVTAALMRANSYQAGTAGMALRGGVAGAVARPAALWTISPAGKVERSNDKGKTWEEVHIDDTVTFRVIQAMGRDVWAGGSGGALYRSSDGGAIWKRVSLSSDGSPATEAIVTIILSKPDLEHITVRTVSGEWWTTEDGGQHWQREP